MSKSDGDEYADIREVLDAIDTFDDSRGTLAGTIAELLYPKAPGDGGIQDSWLGNFYNPMEDLQKQPATVDGRPHIWDPLARSLSPCTYAEWQEVTEGIGTPGEARLKITGDCPNRGLDYVKPDYPRPAWLHRKPRS